MSPEAEQFTGKSRVVAQSAAFPFVMVVMIVFAAIFVYAGPDLKSGAQPIPVWEGRLIQGIAALLLAGAAIALALVAFPTHVAVDAKGIEVRWLWQRRYIPHASITAIETYKYQDRDKLGAARDYGLAITHAAGFEQIPLADEERRRLFITIFARRSSLG